MSQQIIQMAGDEEKEICSEQMASSPHEAIFLVLTYLPLFELLATTQVCKTLRDAINDDILPWLHIIVQPPLSSRLSDHFLLNIASKAQGRLRILSLMNCIRITDHALLSIAAHNPCINKLHVPFCSSLSPLGIIRAVKLLTERNNGLISLRIDGIYGVSKGDLKALQDLIDPNHESQQKEVKMLYHNYKKLSSLRSVDVDVCPVCNEVGMVFDCPLVHCEGIRECRGCELCIRRCKECGVCFSNIQELEDAACTDALCLECWLKLPKCSFCNRPYCNEHAHSQLRISGSPGFLCQSCHSKFHL